MTDLKLAWIQFAIDVEKRGITFYKTCSERMTAQKAKELFNILVGEEEKHRDALTNMLDRDAGGDQAKIKKSLEDFNKMGVDNPMFSEEDIKFVTDPKTLVTDIFNKAADMERKGANIYLDFEAREEDPDTKKFFHNLASQEVRHKKQIIDLGMSLFGMEPEEEELTAEKIEEELKHQKVIPKEITIIAEEGKFKPNRIEVEKGVTMIITLKSIGSPVGFKMINFGVDEYLSPGKELVIKVPADTAGEFDFFSNVPYPGGNEGLKGKLVITGENEPDEDL